VKIQWETGVYLSSEKSENEFSEAGVIRGSAKQEFCRIHFFYLQPTKTHDRTPAISPKLLPLPGHQGTPWSHTSTFPSKHFFPPPQLPTSLSGADQSGCSTYWEITRHRTATCGQCFLGNNRAQNGCLWPKFLGRNLGFLILKFQ